MDFRLWRARCSSTPRQSRATCDRADGEFKHGKERGTTMARAKTTIDSLRISGLGDLTVDEAVAVTGGSSQALGQALGTPANAASVTGLFTSTMVKKGTFPAPFN